MIDLYSAFYIYLAIVAANLTLNGMEIIVTFFFRKYQLLKSIECRINMMDSMKIPKGYSNCSTGSDSIDKWFKLADKFLNICEATGSFVSKFAKQEEKDISQTKVSPQKFESRFVRDSDEEEESQDEELKQKNFTGKGTTFDIIDLAKRIYKEGLNE